MSSRTAESEFTSRLTKMELGWSFLVSCRGKSSPWQVSWRSRGFGLIWERERSVYSYEWSPLGRSRCEWKYSRLPIHRFSQAQILFCVYHPRLAESLDVEAAGAEGWLWDSSIHGIWLPLQFLEPSLGYQGLTASELIGTLIRAGHHDMYCVWNCRSLSPGSQRLAVGLRDLQEWGGVGTLRVHLVWFTPKEPVLGQHGERRGTHPLDIMCWGSKILITNLPSSVVASAGGNPAPHHWELCTWVISPLPPVTAACINGRPGEPRGMPPSFMETKNGAGQLTEGLLVTALCDPAPQCFLELRLYYLLPFSLGSRHLTLLKSACSCLEVFPLLFGGRKLSSIRYLCCESSCSQKADDLS